MSVSYHELSVFYQFCFGAVATKLFVLRFPFQLDLRFFQRPIIPCFCLLENEVDVFDARPVTPFRSIPELFVDQSAQELQQSAKTETGRRKWLKLKLALLPAEATGRRLGSIRQLAWNDIDLQAPTIRWRAETDKKGKMWIVPIPASLATDLRAFRVTMGRCLRRTSLSRARGSSKPVSRDKFGEWLRAAEQLNRVPNIFAVSRARLQLTPQVLWVRLQ